MCLCAVYRLYFKQSWKIDIVKAQTETWIKLDIMSVFLRYKIFHPVPQIIIWWNSNFSSFQGSSRHFKICCMQDYLIDFNEMAQVFECVKNCINCAKKIRPCIAVLDPLRAFFVSLSPQQKQQKQCASLSGQPQALPLPSPVNCLPTPKPHTHPTPTTPIPTCNLTLTHLLSRS